MFSSWTRGSPSARWRSVFSFFSSLYIAHIALCKSISTYVRTSLATSTINYERNEALIKEWIHLFGGKGLANVVYVHRVQSVQLKLFESLIEMAVSRPENQNSWLHHQGCRYIRSLVCVYIFLVYFTCDSFILFSGGFTVGWRRRVSRLDELWTDFWGVELHCLSLSTVCGLSLLSCRLMLLLHRRARTDGQNDGHFFFLVGKRGYRLKEHFHMKNHEAITTTSIDMTSGLLSDDDDWPCCIAAGCSPVPFQRKKSPQKRKKEKRVSRWLLQ